MSNKKKKWNKINKKILIRCAILLGGTAVFVLAVIGLLFLLGVWKSEGSDSGNGKTKTEESLGEGEKLAKKLLPKLNLEVNLLTRNKYSRPGLELKEVKGVVVHYTQNPGTDAIQNRNYFNNLPDINRGSEKPVYASSHFIIGLEGNIVQCIPLAEMAYASNSRNVDTVAIECCHPGEDGKFNKATVQALTELLTYLCIRFELSPTDDIIRHYDVTHKICPKYYVEHPDKWEELKESVEENVTATKKALEKEEEE